MKNQCKEGLDKMNANQAIGLMDSGVGGLTVARELMRQLPNEKMIYIGDNARCPYGPRPVEQVKAFTWEMTRFLQSQEIKMLVIACNTATAVALEELKAQLSIPVVGVIDPGSRAAIKATKNGRVGVIGTVGTIRSHAYEKAIHQKNAQIDVFELACPKLASLVESNETHSAVAKKVVAEQLAAMKKNDVDTLILGCTHYPLLREAIQNTIGKQVTLIDSGAETVNDVSMLLDYFELSAKEKDPQWRHQIYTTGSSTLFKNIAAQWLHDTPSFEVTHRSL